MYHVLTAEVMRQHRRARTRTIFVCLIGAIMTVAGLAWFLLQAPGDLVWIGTLVIFGPITIFLGLITFYTYLENIEEDYYFPANVQERSAQREAPRVSH